MPMNCYLNGYKWSCHWQPGCKWSYSRGICFMMPIFGFAFFYDSIIGKYGTKDKVEWRPWRDLLKFLFLKESK